MLQGVPLLDEVVLFLHIPKAAGSTLMSTISYQYSTGEAFDKSGKNPTTTVYDGSYWPPFDIYNTCYPPYCTSELPDDRLYKASHMFSSQRDSIRAALGHFPFGLHQLVHKPFTYLTMVREPVDR